MNICMPDIGHLAIFLIRVTVSYQLTKPQARSLAQKQIYSQWSKQQLQYTHIHTHTLENTNIYTYKCTYIQSNSPGILSTSLMSNLCFCVRLRLHTRFSYRSYSLEIAHNLEMPLALRSFGSYYYGWDYP